MNDVWCESHRNEGQLEIGLGRSNTICERSLPDWMPHEAKEY
ncbi:hypothetical protein PTI45_04500 [Paenibacillus nuruki]|uniref:Uncharacterized protein n=1 Tax=Paenibacillus nuruki TaxID=1886670 RepID=A0A1E3KX82_9BACL|nr:hypothetical protein PTI45_04500 [Paenibacillus nuruki]